MVMTMILLIGKNIESSIKQPPMTTMTQNKYTSITVVMATHLLAIQIVASVDTQRYLVFILVCGTDGHLSRFCSQMQSLADCGPDNNMLYPHGLPPLVNNMS